jgi:predicted short-subunit dehydrogenase-like oxidoreductase (DUF2520 family)
VTENGINIIGCGKLGKTLARLFLERGAVSSLVVCNRSLASSERAIEFLGTGSCVDAIRDLPPSSLWMVGAPDEEIPRIVIALLKRSSLRPGDIVFHCSGAASSEMFARLRTRGVHVGSVHPIRSFADPVFAAQHFAGTYCAFEGDVDAKDPIARLFQSVGGEVFEIASQAKLLLHAGHVFASNYVVAALECATRLYAEAGVNSKVSGEFMRLLVASAVDNVSRLGTVRALTGPISRGERELVSAQLSVVRSASPLIGELYASLGEVAADLAERQGLSSERVREIREVFKKPAP